MQENVRSYRDFPEKNTEKMQKPLTDGQNCGSISDAKVIPPYHEWQRDGPNEATATGTQVHGANSHSAHTGSIQSSTDR